MSALEFELIKREAPAKDSSIEKSEPRRRVLERAPAESESDRVGSPIPADTTAVTGSTAVTGPQQHRARQPSRRVPDESFPADTPSFAALSPAVDGINGKASGFGGAADGRALYGGEGSISVPLGHRYGFQIDGLIAGVDSELQGNVTGAGAAGHLFWRDPSRGLIGLYSHYLHADAFRGIDVYAGAVEGALYLGRITLEGVAGVEGGEVDRGAFGNTDTRFFDVAQLAYYPTDNLKLSVGHSYVLGENAALFGVEWGVSGGGRAMTALYARGGVFEGGAAAVLGGLRVYFGQRDKTLIRRHREDDLPAQQIIPVTHLNVLE